jgi:cardiolipin synthase (CMP-forming)
MSFRQVPNLICLARLALVVPIAWTLLHHEPKLTLALFIAAALSDGADGFLAKRFGWQTQLGAILDPIADKALLVTLFVTLALLNLVPMWLVLVAVGRDIVIVSGAIAYRVRFGALTVSPSIASKLNTGSQLALVLVVITRAAFAWPPPWVAVALGGLTFVMIMVSGLDYVLTYSARAFAAARAQRAAG